jgi:predicted DNA binding CopG/RHH family protein
MYIQPRNIKKMNKDATKMTRDLESPSYSQQQVKLYKTVKFVDY